jgi:cytochrome c peroxidase
MNRPKVLALLGAIWAAAAIGYVVSGRGSDRPPSGSGDGFTPEEIERIGRLSPLEPPPPDPTNAVYEKDEAALLGRRLFFDPRLSKDGTVSCAVCHAPDRSFADGQALSPKFLLERNVPSLWNVAYNRWFFWDGRADSLWSQALQPLENGREHAGTRLQFAHLVAGDPVLRGAYERVFGAAPDLSDPKRFPPRGGPLAMPENGPERTVWASMAESDRDVVNRLFSNLGKAVAAYERRLVSRGAPFDEFVEGLKTGDAAKLQALGPAARRGLKLFVGRANCVLCHSGPNFTDGEFHNIGIPPARGNFTPDRFAAIEAVRKDPFNGKGTFSDARSAGDTKLDYLVKVQDLWGQIKTPSLRNVAKTAPYMHQGQFKTLEEVVRYYSTLQGMAQAGHSDRLVLAPLRLTPTESSDLAAFLESLTDEQIDPPLRRAPE